MYRNRATFYFDVKMIIHILGNTDQAKRCFDWPSFVLERSHIVCVYNKRVQYVGIFYSLRRTFFGELLQTLYFAFVCPQLLCGIEVYVINSIVQLFVVDLKKSYATEKICLPMLFRISKRLFSQQVRVPKREPLWIMEAKLTLPFVQPIWVSN